MLYENKFSTGANHINRSVVLLGWDVFKKLVIVNDNYGEFR
jgi:hypothetical protein